jgi:hypothetical protein
VRALPHAHKVIVVMGLLNDRMLFGQNFVHGFDHLDQKLLVVLKVMQCVGFVKCIHGGVSASSG